MTSSEPAGTPGVQHTGATRRLNTVIGMLNSLPDLTAEEHTALMHAVDAKAPGKGRGTTEVPPGAESASDAPRGTSGPSKGHSRFHLPGHGEPSSQEPPKG